VRAAAYVRISRDREGQALGVARQEDDCKALAERRGWTVTVHLGIALDKIARS
jgi:DNA invertase Pin-like site-specific DNA recombinase